MSSPDSCVNLKFCFPRWCHQGSRTARVRAGPGRITCQRPPLPGIRTLAEALLTTTAAPLPFSTWAACWHEAATWGSAELGRPGSL